MQVLGNIATIRQQGSLTKIIAEEPDTETWLIHEYTEQAIEIGIRNLANRKAHGNDRIPGEACKATRQWAIRPIAKIMNQIKKGRSIPEDWTIGTIEYIYKNKGDASEYGNYRPICLTQIIYEIWTGLIKRTIAKIMHILTRNNEYGYKEGI